ncbi:MAG: PQQ-dependent sugar dehydrogenase [Adhaeribacter sp.]
MIWSCSRKENQARIRIFSASQQQGQAVGEVREAIMKLAAAQNILLDVSDNPAGLSEQLSQYDALIFLGDFGARLNKQQQQELEAYVGAGGGFMGIEAALPDGQSWPWYTAMYQESDRQQAVVRVNQGAAPTASANPHSFVRNQAYEGGRISLIGMPGSQAAKPRVGFQDNFLKGLGFVINAEAPLQAVGAGQGDSEKRFHRRVLHKDLVEGVKMAIAENGAIYYIERGGRIYCHTPGSGALGSTREIGRIEVSTVSGNGLLGIALDPGFARNNLVYLYYTPLKTKSLHQKLSRFRVSDSGLDMGSEKVMLRIPYDFPDDAHTGGALLFDDKGNLFVSTGDNTQPHEANGFGPLDDRPGRQIFDAQRTAGNTASLLGKILRITPQADASYTIPEGNLFSGKNGKDRPEIYVMGCRNPYTLSYDAPSGYLYWGEVGPDAGRDSTLGPRGYDEINRTRQAGFFGWPYFTGENKAYAVLDFATRKTKGFFDPAAPLNKSRNNTGSTLLPPAQTTFIAYPYSKSAKFPEMGEGTRCAIAGPVYHYDPDLASAVKFPKEYDQVLFIADWSRKWIMTVHLDGQGNYAHCKPFMPLTAFDRPMDLKFGPDGALYLLEYGEPWGIFKTYGSLVRLEHHAGNRPPLAVLSASDTVGREPLTVKFSSRGSRDFDGDQVKMTWSIGGKKLAAQHGDPSFTFQQPGNYLALLTVTDEKGLSSQDWIQIKVGNSRPQVQLATQANQTFYWDDTVFDYQVTVQDREDGPAAARGLQVDLDYLPEGKDVAGLFIGSQEIRTLKSGKGSMLMAKSDCKTCHKPDQPALGPSLQQIARRYGDNQATVDLLARKVISGGGGMWGSFAMAAHPQVSYRDASAMVRYILSLDAPGQAAQGLPPQGRLQLNQHAGKGNEGLYILTASYTDKGHQGIAPLSDVSQIRLRHPRLEAAAFDGSKGLAKVDDGRGGALVGQVRTGAWFYFKDIDLHQVGQLSFHLEPGESRGYIEVRAGSPQGRVLSRLDYQPATGPRTLRAPVQATAGKQSLYFVFGGGAAASQSSLRLHWVSFDRRQQPPLAKAGKVKLPSRS